MDPIMRGFLYFCVFFIIIGLTIAGIGFLQLQLFLNRKTASEKRREARAKDCNESMQYGNQNNDLAFLPKETEVFFHCLCTGNIAIYGALRALIYLASDVKGQSFFSNPKYKNNELLEAVANHPEITVSTYARKYIESVRDRMMIVRPLQKDAQSYMLFTKSIEAKINIINMEYESLVNYANSFSGYMSEKCKTILSDIHDEFLFYRDNLRRELSNF